MMGRGERSRLMAQIHIARKQLGMDDETYRAALQNAARKESCADMSVIQLRATVEHFRKLGFKNQTNPSGRAKSPASKQKKPSAKTQQDKLRALWIDAAKDGLLRDGSETALCRWAGRMTKKYNNGVAVESIEWMNVDQLQGLIEDLKKWIARLDKERASNMKKTLLEE